MIFLTNYVNGPTPFENGVYKNLLFYYFLNRSGTTTFESSQWLSYVAEITKSSPDAVTMDFGIQKNVTTDETSIHASDIEFRCVK